MKFGKKDGMSEVEQAVGRAASYEVTIADQARRSERRAAWVAGTAVVMALILASGYFLVMPLKERTPYLVMADAYTGTATVARLREGNISGSEALNRANVAAFLRSRESYDWTLIGTRDWSTVFTMAEPQVSSAYRELYSTRNPSGPLALYGKAQSIRIRILSIQPFGGDAKKGPAGATVRFQRSLFDKASGTSRFVDNKIATLEYTYKPNLEMSEEDRLLNPLGFRVMAYRVDNDYATTPGIGDDPVAPVAAPAAPTVATAPVDMPGVDPPPQHAAPPQGADAP